MTWQEVVVAFIIAGALAFLVRHWFFREQTGCGKGCNGCSPVEEAVQRRIAQGFDDHQHANRDQARR